MPYTGRRCTGKAACIRLGKRGGRVAEVLERRRTVSERLQADVVGAGVEMRQHRG